MNPYSLSPERYTLLKPGSIAILGIPSDENSSFLRGPAQAPVQIRAALHSGSANLCAENGMDLGAGPAYLDLGDLTIGCGAAAMDQITEAVSQVVESGARLLCLGGDHAITYPILRGFARAAVSGPDRRFQRLNLLHIDAHSDLYSEFQGNRFSHASPFARIMEEKLVNRLVQVGIRTHTPHTREQAARFKVETIEMRDWQPGALPDLEGPTYLSFDMDALDPAFAPGVSHYEPGGFTTREAIALIQSLHVPLVGADIVEFNPVRDPQGITAMVAAKLLKEIVAKMTEI